MHGYDSPNLIYQGLLDKQMLSVLRPSTLEHGMDVKTLSTSQQEKGLLQKALLLEIPYFLSTGG